MLSLIIALLTTFSPILIKVGSWLIDMFISDVQKRADAKIAFLGAIQLHINDALQTVADRKSYQDQLDELIKGQDNAAP